MLVSAIMPTRARPEFAAVALACFRAQTCKETELIIVDDADAPSFPVPPDGVVYLRMPRRLTIGAKRNLACTLARGEVLIHFDDDDWSAPSRMEDQVRRLVQAKAPITGYRSLTYQDDAGARWQYRGASNYAVGCTLCYTREFWLANQFPNRDVGEDNEFVYASRGRIVTAEAGDLMIARIHAGNTSDKRRSIAAGADCWKRVA